MPLSFLVLIQLFTFFNLSKARMDCTVVDQVYSRMRGSLYSSPIYQILRDRDTSLCHRQRAEKSSYVIYQPTCCTLDKEMALALTSSTLFRQYLYTTSLEEYVFALDDIISYYKKDVGRILDPELKDFVMDYIKHHGGGRASVRNIMKEHLRILLERKEQIDIPAISEPCFQTAVSFIKTFAEYLEGFLQPLTALQEGVHLAIRLLDSLKNQKVSPRCVEAVTRSSVMTIGCNQCDPATATYKTCRSLCANVVNGCMKPLLTVLPTWYEWFQTMDGLDFDITKVKQRLLEQDVKGELYKSFTIDYHNLSEKCDVNRTSPATGNRRVRNFLPGDKLAHDTRPLYQDMFNSMFEDLQTKFCRGLDLSSQFDSGMCWNGTHVAPYTRNLTYFNEESQVNNPEVTDNSYIHFTAQRAIKELKEFNQLYSSFKEKDDIKMSINSFNTTSPFSKPQLPLRNEIPTVITSGARSRPSWNLALLLLAVWWIVIVN